MLHRIQKIAAEVAEDEDVGARGLDPREDLTDRGLELAWRLHGGFFYLGVRRWIYGLETPEDLDEVVRDGVAQFLSGAGSILSAIHPAATAPEGGS